jgi:hypothetical protein
MGTVLDFVTLDQAIEKKESDKFDSSISYE